LKIKLAYKIFGAFLLTSFLVVAFMVGTMRYYVSRHFADYVNQNTLDRLGALTAELAAEYQAHQGWQYLRNNPDRWQDILESALSQSGFERFSPRRQTDEPIEPPVPELSAVPERKALATKRHKEVPSQLRANLHRLARVLALFDAERQPIAGRSPRNSADAYTLREITVGSRTVGWLGLPKRERLFNSLEVSFIKNQSLAFYLIGGGILLLAAVVSFLLAKHFLAPIHRLTEGTRALADFKFDTKIDVHTQDELGHLAADFNRMAATLKKYEDMRRQWISDVSHELRTPLAILRGEIEALQDGIRCPDKANLGSLHSEVVRLGKLVEDLHLLTLADTQNLLARKDTVRPLEILREMVARYETRLERKKIDTRLTLSFAEPILLRGDADRLSQLFSNLLENTLRYTHSPGSLKIYEHHTKDRLTIYFEDSAPGVPEEALERIFDRLYRVDKSRSRELGGSGLGLAICKQIVQAHGGAIQAANVPSGGLRIQIELPLRENTNATIII
jgi:two-component system sensor histidine kinase BaeS